MNRQVVLIAIWLASLAATGVWQNSVGHEAERLIFLQRDFADLADANNKIVELNTAIADERAAHANRISDISQDYEKDKQNVANETARIIADLRANRLRLRDPGITHSAANTEAGITSPTSKCDGATAGRLSVTTAEFLTGLTGEANQIVEQLSKCQDVVLSDRIVVDKHNLLK